MIESFGVENVELSELWSLDEDSLSSLGKVYGLVFLFKWQSNDAGVSSGDCLTSDDFPHGLFFARQTTTNACATQAILSVLLNASEEEDMVLGPMLTNFKSFTSAFTPELLGEAIGASEEIRTSHNSFTRPDSFLSEQKKRIATDDDDVFHFVAYVPHRGDKNVYELDGLKEGPICLGSFGNSEDKVDDDNAWLKVAKNAIQDRIERYASSEIKFNLMAIVRDKRVDLVKKLNFLTESGESEESEDVKQIKMLLSCEEEKREQWKLENNRRKHNYLPFCVELLKALASSGKLPELTKKANERTMAKRRRVMGEKLVAEAKK